MVAVLVQNELIHLVDDKPPFRSIVGGPIEARALASILDSSEAPNLVALMAYHQPGLSAVLARMWRNDVSRLRLVGDLYEEADRLEARYGPVWEHYGDPSGEPTMVRIAE